MRKSMLLISGLCCCYCWFSGVKKSGVKNLLERKFSSIKPLPLTKLSRVKFFFTTKFPRSEIFNRQYFRVPHFPRLNFDDQFYRDKTFEYGITGDREKGLFYYFNIVRNTSNKLDS